MPSAILLAAGSSTRLGQPKQSLRIANETLLERAVRIAGLAGLSPIFVIVSLAAAQNPETKLGAPSFRGLVSKGWGHAPTNPSAASMAPGGVANTDIEVLINHEATEGMASSIRIGVRASIAADSSGAVILACDQVAVTPEHLRALTQAETEVRASSYAGHNGIPAYFPNSSFEQLLLLHGDIGARALLRHAAAIQLLDGDLDIDSPADLERARRLYPDLRPIGP